MTMAPPSERLIVLSPSEWRVYCALRYDGANDLTIARRLDLSKNTVKTHLRRIFAKADVASRAALLAAELNGEVRFLNRDGRQRVAPND